MFGGEPLGCLIGDYYFDNHPKDVALLRNMEKVCAAAHTPFIAAAAPATLNMESWQELMEPRDLTKIVSTPEYASWNSLRKTEDARYIGLTMPRSLAPTLRRQDRPGRGLLLRGGHRRQRSPQVRVDERRLLHGRQHQSLVQALRLVLAHPGRQIGRRRPTCRCTPSPTTAGWR